MQFLAEELSDPQAAPCGKCANCTGEELGAAFPHQLAEEAARFLERLSLPIELKKQWPQGSTFEGERGRIPKEFRGEEGRALCKWGDAGFGDLVPSRVPQEHGVKPIPWRAKIPVNQSFPTKPRFASGGDVEKCRGK